MRGDFSCIIKLDVDLTVQGHTIPAHKILLASRSQFFRQKFDADPDLSKIDLTSEVGSLDVLFAMIDYLYTENLNLQRIGA